MSDLMDKTEAELQQIASRVTMQVARSHVQFSVKLTSHVTHAAYKALAAMSLSVANRIHPQQGKVSLKTFSNLGGDKRDVLTLDDAAVSSELQRELKRHGVTWSVESHTDGSRTFHVLGKDTALIHHALKVASDRVDRRTLSKSRTDHRLANTRNKVSQRISAIIAKKKAISDSAPTLAKEVTKAMSLKIR